MLFNNSISCCYNLFSSPIIEAEFCVFFNQFSTISGWINLLFCLLDWLIPPLPPRSLITCCLSRAWVISAPAVCLGRWEAFLSDKCSWSIMYVCLMEISCSVIFSFSFLLSPSSSLSPHGPYGTPSLVAEYLPSYIPLSNWL